MLAPLAAFLVVDFLAVVARGLVAEVFAVAGLDAGLVAGFEAAGLRVVAGLVAAAGLAAAVLVLRIDCTSLLAVLLAGAALTAGFLAAGFFGGVGMVTKPL